MASAATGTRRRQQADLLMFRLGVNISITDIYSVSQKNPHPAVF